MNDDDRLFYKVVWLPMTATFHLLSAGKSGKKNKFDVQMIHTKKIDFLYVFPFVDDWSSSDVNNTQCPLFSRAARERKRES